MKLNRTAHLNGVNPKAGRTRYKEYRPALITASAIRRRAAIDFIGERCAKSSIAAVQFSSSVSLAIPRARRSIRNAASRANTRVMSTCTRQLSLPFELTNR
jgi:hypothetical protein